jgi:hypothetical protein
MNQFLGLNLVASPDHSSCWPVHMAALIQRAICVIKQFISQMRPHIKNLLFISFGLLARTRRGLKDPRISFDIKARTKVNVSFEILYSRSSVVVNSPI